MKTGFVRLILPGVLLAAQVVAAGTLAQFRTSLGDIEVELFDQQKPATVANFIRYVESGRYQENLIHRLEPGYVMQGGGYWMSNRFATNWSAVTVISFGTLSNEFATGPRLSNTNGTIAMAKSAGNPDSATSQWFFNLGDNSRLDTNNGGFTVFGRVVGGTNVFEQFRQFQYYTSTNQTSNMVVLGYYPAPFNQLPVLLPVIAATNFIYCDITLLNVHVAAVEGGREISWQSVAGVTNRVEFTAGFSPPAWQTLVATNGDGAAMKFPDLNPAASARFYRVRVDY